VRIEKLWEKYDIEVRFVHYPLHPDTPDEGMTLEALFAGRNIDIAASQAKMVGLMNDEGLPYGTRTMTYNSRLAQELAKWAESQPGGYAIHDALFRAYFVDQINLAEVDELVSIAARIGLPTDDARSVLESRSQKQAVDADWRQSREIGLTGVPAFVIGEQCVVGAQPFEVLEQLVVNAGAKSRNGGGS